MKPFGFRGTLTPKSAFKEIEENHSFKNILVSIKNGIFEVGYDKEDEKDRALKIANALIASWSKRNNIKIEIEFNQSWQVKPGTNKFIAMGLHDEVKAVDQVVTTTVTMKVMAYIVKSHSNSYSFTEDIEIAKKAETDETLAEALKHFHDEVIDHKKPMYGIHKAIEQIIKHMPGKNENEKRNKLAEITGYDRLYIDDLMTSIQVERHSKEWLRLHKIGKIIEDKECIERAKNLIDGYTTSLTVQD